MVTASCGSGTGSRKGQVVGGKIDALHMYCLTFARTETIVLLVHVLLATGADHALREVQGRPEHLGRRERVRNARVSR